MAKNILIVDDAAFMRMMIKDILTKNDYNVTFNGAITIRNGGSISWIDSNNITIDDDVVIVKLTNAYALPVKGAYYDVIIPEGIVKDELEHPNEEKNYENKVIIKKIEEPVVRIDKKREYLNNGSVVLPKNVGVKIESQTPSAQIYYSKYQNEISKHTWTSNGSNLKSYTMPTNFSRPGDLTTRYTSEFNILTNPNDEKGYIVYLKAKATKTFDGDTKNTESEESYAVAKRQNCHEWRF